MHHEETLKAPPVLCRRVAVVVAVLIGSFWLTTLLTAALPAHWLRWYVLVDVEISSVGSDDDAGQARVYYDVGNGFSESQTIDLAVQSGRQKLRFPLPEKPVKNLRFDPVDQQVSFVVHELRLVGPLGREIVAPDSKKNNHPVEISLKPEQAINATQTGGSASSSFDATTEDPHFYLRVKPKPVPFPSAIHQLVERLVRGMAVFLCALVALVVTKRGRLDQLVSLVFVLAVAAVVAWVMAYYLLTVRQIDPGFAYRVVLPLLLLAPLLAWIQGGIPRRRVPLAAWVLVVWLAYFGLRGLAIKSGSVPSSLDLLLAAFCLLALLGAGLACAEDVWRRFLKRGFVIWVPVAVGSALFILIRSYHPDWDLAYRVAYFQSPLFRPISGSACFALAAVALVALMAERRLPRLLRVLMIVALAILSVYFLQAKSRAVAVGVVVAVIFVSALSRSIQVTIAGVLTLSFCFVFAYTPWPSSFADALTDGRAPAPQEETLEVYRIEGSLVRPDIMRPTIYSAYLKASVRHPFFGHGFAGDHAIIIDSEEFAKMLPDYAGRPWNPHNFHLSILYFGGIVGVVLHALMLGLPMWLGLRAFLKTRDPMLLALLGMVAFAGINLLFESTMMNGAKDAVVFWRPNEYWLFFWGPLILLNIHLSHSPISLHPQCDENPDLSAVS